MLTVQEIVSKYGKNEKDTGATEVQVALLTQRIAGLTGHFEKHKSDFNSKRGLMKLIGARRRKLRYLASRDEEKYKNLINALGLRK